jgi:hypothetical protein
MPGPPPHVHPASEEGFEVLEGSLDVFQDGEWTTLRPGERAAVPANVRHTFRHPSDEAAKVVIRIRPAGRTEAFFRHMHRLVTEGKLKRLPPKEPGFGDLLFDAVQGVPGLDSPDRTARRRHHDAGVHREGASLQALA